MRTRINIYTVFNFGVWMKKIRVLICVEIPLGIFHYAQKLK